MKSKFLILLAFFVISAVSCGQKDKWINPEDSNADLSEFQKICRQNGAECGNLDVIYKGSFFTIDCGGCADGLTCNTDLNLCENIDECESSYLNDCPDITYCHDLDPKDEESLGKQYECICRENFSGENGYDCVPDTREVKCAGLPSGAEWNGNGKIEQTWDGYDWYPSNKGEYNLSSDAGHCYFKCMEQFTWNGSGCEGETREGDCDEKPEHSEWNDDGRNGKFGQSWDGEEWSPASHSSSYNETAGECKFVCIPDFIWYDGACIEYSRTFTCKGKPANSVWNGVSSYAQEWDGSHWVPSDSEAVYNDYEECTQSCCFKCDTNYNYNEESNTCEALTRNWECGKKPANSEWNDDGRGGTFKQTWDDGEWIPASKTAQHSPAAAGECKFKCSDGHFYVQSSNLCEEAETKTRSCPAKPANSAWNNGNTFTQTCQGDDCQPATADVKATYSATPGVCTFVCNRHYLYNSSTSKCQEADYRTYYCDEEKLPDGAEWTSGSEEITQYALDIDGSSWTTVIYTYNEDPDPNNEECRYKCRSECDEWNGSECYCH